MDRNAAPNYIIGPIKTAADLERTIGLLIAELRSKDVSCQAAAEKLESAQRQADKLAVAKDVNEVGKCPGVLERLMEIARATGPDVRGTFFDGLIFALSAYGI